MTRAEQRLNDVVFALLLRREDEGQCPPLFESPAPDDTGEDAWDGTS